MIGLGTYGHISLVDNYRPRSEGDNVIGGILRLQNTLTDCGVALDLLFPFSSVNSSPISYQI